MNWENLRESEFNDAIEKSGGLCIIPIGCLEKHGQHLPVGTDSLRAQAICEQAAELSEAVVFPCQMALGDVMGYHRNSFDSTISRKMHGGIGLSPELLLKVYEELCDEIHRNGFRKILFANTHGGNIAFLDFFVRGIGYRKKDYAVMWTPVGFNELKLKSLISDVEHNRKKYDYISEEDLKTLHHYAETGFGGGHADFRETAQIMGIDKSLVSEKDYETESGLSTGRADYLSDNGIHTGFAWGCNFPNMYNAYPPHGVTEGIGKLFMDASVEALAKKIKLLKEDEDCVSMATGSQQKG